jgi:molybdopterin-binding protein
MSNPCTGNDCAPAFIPGLIGGYWTSQAKSGRIVLGTGIDDCCEVFENPCCCVEDEYENTAQTCEDICPEGTVGDPLSVTVAAGAHTSTVSQEVANALALAAACAQVAALRAATPCLFPNTEQTCSDTCVYGNQEQSYTDSCGDGFTGDPITVTIGVGEVTSEISIAAATAAALAQITAEAEALRVLTPCVENPADTIVVGLDDVYVGADLVLATP